MCGFTLFVFFRAGFGRFQPPRKTPKEATWGGRTFGATNQRICEKYFLGESIFECGGFRHIQKYFRPEDDVSQIR